MKRITGIILALALCMVIAPAALGAPIDPGVYSHFSELIGISDLAVLEKYTVEIPDGSGLTATLPYVFDYVIDGIVSEGDAVLDIYMNYGGRFKVGDRIIFIMAFEYLTGREDEICGNVIFSAEIGRAHV